MGEGERMEEMMRKKMNWYLKFEFDIHQWHITPLVGVWHNDPDTRIAVGWLCVKLVLEGFNNEWIPF